MRIVIDTRIIWNKIKGFWLYTILRKPRPKPDLKDLLKTAVAVGIGSYVMSIANDIIDKESLNNKETKKKGD